MTTGPKKDFIVSLIFDPLKWQIGALMNYNNLEDEEHKKDKKELSCDGFLYGNKEDKALALLEEKKIEQLERRMRYEDRDQVKTVYDKAIENRVFQTPSGLQYLKRLQKYLINSGYENYEIQDIPVYHNFTQAVRIKETYLTPNIKPSNAKTKKIQNQFRTLKVVIAGLVIIIIVMFVITLTGKNPNIINYENALVDKYAKWEQELSQRESIVREKEQELNIEAK